MGATDVINADKENVAEAIQEMTKGEGVDVVADASGDPEGLNQAVSLVNRFGLIVGFSLISATEPVVFNHQAWMRKAARLAPTVSGASPTPTEAIEKMVALRDRGWADPGKLITHRVGWDGIPDAYEMYANRSDQVIKVVMDING
jgi:threonine dehydrogenase-like Zn-dependent dehydrogenase